LIAIAVRTIIPAVRVQQFDPAATTARADIRAAVGAVPR
jgi:hypothetical protein